MTSPITWNPFTNNIDYVGSGAAAGVTSVTGQNGIIANPTTGDVIVKLDDFVSGQTSTTGVEEKTIITIPLGGASGSFQFEARVKAFEATTPAGAGYNVCATFITDGLTATLVGDQPVLNENPALEDADSYFVAEANNAVLKVLGVTGLTISWSAESEIT